MKSRKTTAIIKERPIIFSGESVRAAREDRKTDTRRVMVPQPIRTHDGWAWSKDGKWTVPDLVPHVGAHWRVDVKPHESGAAGILDMCPFGNVGDRLWVKETAIVRAAGKAALYRADVSSDVEAAGLSGPRRLSRLTIEITGIRVEQLGDMSPADVTAEGCMFSSDLDHFKAMWNDLNAKRGFPWDPQLWVWALSFKRIKPK